MLMKNNFWGCCEWSPWRSKIESFLPNFEYKSSFDLLVSGSLDFVSLQDVFEIDQNNKYKLSSKGINRLVDVLHNVMDSEYEFSRNDFSSYIDKLRKETKCKIVK